MGRDRSSRSHKRFRRGWRLLVVLALLGALVAVLWAPVERHLEAAALLLRFESPEEPHEGLAGFGIHEVRESAGELQTEAGTLRVRRYVPQDGELPPKLLLVHGVHPDGIDEPRLVRFAKNMASAGVAVVTPEIATLTRYRIEPDAIGTIGRAARAVAERSERERVGVMGISFSGGLALLAARQSRYGKAMAYIVAVGAHHDLHRVVRWYAGAAIEGPKGREPPADPNPYGAGVFIHSQLDAFFSQRDLAPARKALERALRGDLKGARELRSELSPEGRSQLDRVLARDAKSTLRKQVLQEARAHRDELRTVSPSRGLDGLDTPVFLVHGTGDPVVPSTETRWLAREVPEAALEQKVVTPFLRHAGQEGAPSWKERWELVRLMAKVLAGAHAS